MANSLNDHNGSADVDTQLGSYRFSRFVTKSTHFPHSHSFSLSSSLWKVLNTFFPRKYHFPRKQTVRYSLLFFALTFYFWGVRFSFLLRSVVCLTDDFLFVSFQETVDFFFLEKMDKKYHLSLYLTVLVFFASLGSQALAFTDPLDGNIVIGHFYMEYFLWKFAYFIGDYYW